MRPTFPGNFQCLVLCFTPIPSCHDLRGYHPLWRPIPGNFNHGKKALNGIKPLNPTSPFSCEKGFGLPSAAFPRRYSRHPVLVSFPPGTKMIQFPGFPLPKGSASQREASLLIQASPGRRLHAPHRGFSQLATPFFGFRAQPSTTRREVDVCPFTYQDPIHEHHRKHNCLLALHPSASLRNS